jgi:hypothetical protein
MKLRQGVQSKIKLFGKENGIQNWLTQTSSSSNWLVKQKGQSKDTEKQVTTRI